MPIDISTTVTGDAINGFTAPTYILTADTPPAANAKQSVVTNLGGTQTGVTTHSPSDPFTLTVTKPVVPVGYPKTNAQGIVPSKVGRNKYNFNVRKGTKPLVGQSPQVSDVRLELNIVSGAEVNDVANVAAALNLAICAAKRELANLLNTAKTATI